MMRRNQTPDASIASVYVAVGLLGALLVAVAHPVAAGFGLLAASGVVLSVRALWRQATSVGLSLPGTRGKLRVETGAVHDDQKQWAITVSITES